MPPPTEMAIIIIMFSFYPILYQFTEVAKITPILKCPNTPPPFGTVESIFFHFVYC